MFKLRTEKGRQQVRRQIARPNIDPCVLVDLATEKSAPICSLFPKNLRPLIKGRIVDQQRTAFSAGEILSFMETERSKLSKCAEVSSAISSIKTMRIVFDYSNTMPLRNRCDRIHFASDTRIMHKKNRFRARGNASLDLALVNVEGVRPNIHEDRPGAS